MRTVPETIVVIRDAMTREDIANVFISKEEIAALCDEIEKLERDVELAKQDWRA